LNPRASWTEADYAKATGRDIETIDNLKSRIGRDMTLDSARALAVKQGIDPDRIGKVVK
jgi:predicted flap endonuclease-1-like 5' DNA nuclease